jgi:hypothetical protein
MLVPFLLVATAAAMDVLVTCTSAPRYYTIDGMPNRQLSIVAGESIFFHFDASCVGHPMQIQRIDGTPYPLPGPHTMLATHGGTPECLIYVCMTHPATMTGTISVVGGMPCGASVSAATTLYNRPIITPLPVPVVPAPLYTIPTTTTTVLYPTLYASGSLSTTLYPPATTITYPPACPARACPALLPCILPAYQRSDTLADGCLGCPYCYNPSLYLPPITLPPVTILPPIVCPVRSCPLLPKCILPAIEKVDMMADGCPGCAYCGLPSTAPCVGLYCLPCCPPIVVEGMTCRSCVSFV